jgi:copper(I)-binding protein
VRRAAPPAALLVALLLAGCVYYPTIADVGGVRIRPQSGRAVLQPAGLSVYMDLDSTGRDGDVIIGAVSEVARNAVIVPAADQPGPGIAVPGATLVRLSPGGARIDLTDLSRTVTPGEVILVTLLFQRLGRIGVPARIE